MIFFGKSEDDDASDDWPCVAPLQNESIERVETLDAKEQTSKLLAKTTLPMAPLGSSKPSSAQIYYDPGLAGEWTQRLDELQRDVASVRVDLQAKAKKPEHMHLVNRVAAWENCFRAVCIEAEAWHRRERKRIHASALDLESSREITGHRIQRQLVEEDLGKVRAELHAVQCAKSEHRIAKIETKKLREELLAKEAEYDAMLLTSKKQEATLEAARRELELLHTDNRGLCEKIHSETDAVIEVRAERGLANMENMQLMQQLRTNQTEHEAMLLAAKKQELCSQLMGDDLASVKEQLRQALDREIQGERAREELMRRLNNSGEALQHVQEHESLLEVGMKSLDAALVASAATVAKRDQSIDEAGAKTKQLEEHLASSKAEAADYAKAVQRMQNLVLLSNAAVDNAESKQADYAQELKAMQDVNEKLEERVYSLQGALTSSMKNQLLCKSEAAEARDSQDMCTSLQAKVQSLEAALSTSNGHLVNLANKGSLTAAVRPMYSRDYPRSSHSTKLRTAVLSARTRPGAYMDY